jgi:hypothetical protein
MSLRGAELHGILIVEVYSSGGSFVRKFIIPSVNTKLSNVLVYFSRSRALGY